MQPANKNKLIFSNEKNGGFVLMELFTSQGCSSCPAAEELMGKYIHQNNPKIISLAYHVDYWNRLGWKDSFSDARFSQRQTEYAAKLNVETVYTPQLVINGQKELVGSDKEKLKGFVEDFQNGKASVSIELKDLVQKEGLITASYALEGNFRNKIMHGALVQQEALTPVKSGENKGLNLLEYNVVRDFVSIKITKSEGILQFSLPQINTAKGFVIVIFLQDIETFKIEGATQKIIGG
jgi:hypothetical protein